MGFISSSTVYFPDIFLGLYIRFTHIRSFLILKDVILYFHKISR